MRAKKILLFFLSLTFSRGKIIATVITMNDSDESDDDEDDDDDNSDVDVDDEEKSIKFSFLNN